MTTRSREATQTDTLFMMLGMLAGVLTMLLISWLWQGYISNPGHSILSGFSQVFVGTIPASLQAMLADQARLMGLPLSADSQAYWFLARAGGIVAYLLLWFATAWGIVMSSKIANGAISSPLAYGLHEFFPILAMIFAAGHALILLGDSYIGFNLFDVLIPFTSPYEPLWTGLGTLALYLSIALIASFYVRKRIGRKVWRAFHYTSYVSFLLALVHGLMAGTDSQWTVIQGMYLVTGVSLLFLTYYRLLTVKPRPKSRRTASAARRSS